MYRKVRLPECQICYGSLSSPLVCDCGFFACDDCYARVFLDSATEVEELSRLACVACKATFPVKRIRDVLGAARLSALIRRCAERQAEHLEATVIPAMEDRKAREEAANKLVAQRFPYMSAKARRQVVSQMTLGASLRCGRPGCDHKSLSTPGEDRGMCLNGHLTCVKCLAPVADPSADGASAPSGPFRDHRCDPDTIKTLNKIREDTKECPGCTTPTHRIAGCHHMYCVVCKSDWDWQSRTLKSQAHNPHNPATNRRRDPLDIPGGDLPPLRSPEGSLTGLFHECMPMILFMRIILSRLELPSHLADTTKRAKGRLSRSTWVSRLVTVQLTTARVSAYRDVLEDLFLTSLDLLRADKGDLVTEQAFAELMHSTNQRHRVLFTYSAFASDEDLGDMIIIEKDGKLTIRGIPSI